MELTRDMNTLKDKIWIRINLINPAFAEIISVLARYKRGMSMKKYKKDVKQYNRLILDSRAKDVFDLKPQYYNPILYDCSEEAGTVGDYFTQDLLMAQEIFCKMPEMHYDIASRVDGFIAHLLSFRQKVTMIDVRPLTIDISGLHFIKSNATNLDNIESNSLESISSLHAVEHFGLGRYGDPIDPDGSFKAMSELQRVCKNSGIIYFSVPVSKENICQFNAQRIFKLETVLEHFAECELKRFICIKNGKVVIDVACCKAELLCKDIDLEDVCTGVFIFEKR